MNKKLNSTIKILSLISTFIFFILLLGFEIYIILKYPDTTKTRLFLMFWKQYLGISLGILFSHTIYNYTSNKELNDLINRLNRRR